jgi:hypothetical protein
MRAGESQSLAGVVETLLHDHKDAVAEAVFRSARCFRWHGASELQRKVMRTLHWGQAASI